MNVLIESLSNIQTFLLQILYIVPLVLICLAVHETSHGYMSYLFGDPTAKDAGRLTLNPLKHLDPIGTISMILFKFGWARPVPINPAFYKNKKLGIIMTSIAGPLSNLLMGLVTNIVLFFFANYGIVTDILFTFTILNYSLAVFNLLPIPPLDGSKIVFALLPSKTYFKVLQYERYGSIILIVLILTNVLDNILSGGVMFLYKSVLSVMIALFGGFYG